MKIESFSGRWAFLSNFYPAEIEHRGITYPTVEHFYVAMKVGGMQLINGTHYTPDDLREYISTIFSPGAAKRFGSKIALRKDWDEVKLGLMEWAVRQKFGDEVLAAQLVGTGDSELVEGNSWGDTYWGVCNGKGKNHLGRILMKIRDELRGTERKGLEQFLT